MFLKRRLAALAAVIAALAIGAPVASPAAATIPATGPVSGAPGCLYPNPATGCGPPACPYSTNPYTGCAPYWAIDPSLLTYPGPFWLGH
jgi:hypothetical protein